MSKYKSAIERITVTDATFKRSTEREIEPTWINFFFGNNGSGKTTISRAIRNDNGLQWQPGKSAGDYNVLVYNRDFVTRELQFEDETPLMPGVLMIGEDSIETRREIDEMQLEQDRLGGEIEKAKTERNERITKKNNLLTRFQRACWESAGKFYNAFGGRKGDFQSQAKCADRVLRTRPVEHDFNELKSRYDTASDPNARQFDLLPLLDISKLEAAENFTLLGQAIISTADNEYSRFWESLNATEFIKQIHDRFIDRTHGLCPYCKQEIPPDFEEQYAACFNSRYADDCERLERYQKQYTEYMSNFIGAIERYVTETIMHGFGNLQAFKEKLASLELLIVKNNAQITSKVEKPSIPITLESVREYLEEINRLIEEANKGITENNSIFLAKERTQADCIAKVWESLAFEMRNVVTANIEENAELDSKIKEFSEQFEKHRQAAGLLNGEIIKASERLGGSTVAVEKINGLLKKYGFMGFALVPDERIPDKYCVVRDDKTPAKGLSEGEKNFIAFLYFYYLAHGAWKREDLVKGKIVVIDDPVSSLDSSVLFVVGALVRDLIDDCYLDGQKHNIKQIFILTHNPYFHKDVSSKYETSIEELVKKSLFSVVKKNDDNISLVFPCEREASDRDSEIEMENVSPVQSSYSAMWSDYRDAKLPTTLLAAIHRIVEYHFIQHCSYTIDYLRTKIFASMEEDDANLRLAMDMIKYIYDHANEYHDISDGIFYSPDNDSIPKIKAVFKKIFIEMGQVQHYQKMSGEIDNIAG